MKPPNGPRKSTTPLQRAKSHERVATLSITMIVGVAATIVIAAMMATGGKPAVQQQHLISIIGTFTQFIVSLATLALIGRQVSVAVGQIEQAEQTEASILQLTAAVHRMVGTESLPRGIRQSPRHADASRRTTRP